jgi:hypothetical protein
MQLQRNCVVVCHCNQANALNAPDDASRFAFAGNAEKTNSLLEPVGKLRLRRGLHGSNVLGLLSLCLGLSVPIEQHLVTGTAQRGKRH